MAIQRLISKGLIEAKGNTKEYVVTAEADQIFSELMIVQNDLEQIQFEGFSREEMDLFALAR